MGPYPSQQVVFADSLGNHPALRSDWPTTQKLYDFAVFSLRRCKAEMGLVREWFPFPSWRVPDCFVPPFRKRKCGR